MWGTLIRIRITTLPEIPIQIITATAEEMQGLFSEMCSPGHPIITTQVTQLLQATRGRVLRVHQVVLHLAAAAEAVRMRLQEDFSSEFFIKLFI